MLVVRLLMLVVLLVFAGLTALLGGGLILILSTVGVCAAGCLILYEFAQLLRFLFDISVRWGLVSACASALAALGVVALIHDFRMIRGLKRAGLSPAPDA